MTQRFENIIIEGISAAVPKRIVSNDTLFESSLNTKDRNVFEKTVGIKERRWVNDDTTASDLAYHASDLLLSNEHFDRSEIECIIFISQTPDFKIPFTSNILQDRLKVDKKCLCLDINAGCAGFVQGLSVASSIASNLKGKVLLVIAETLSKILSPNDKSTNLLFGDAASALIISKNISYKNDFWFNYFSDGSNYDAIMIPDGGYRNPFSINSLSMQNIDTDNNSATGIHLHMDGAKVFDFTLREVAKSIQLLLNDASLTLDQIDLLALHQSNKFILKQISKRLGILGDDKLLINIENFGNTSGVSIPLLLVTNSEKCKNKKILCSGYGSGLNWGNAIINLKQTLILPLLEI